MSVNPRTTKILVVLAQYAEAGCYYKKKRHDGNLFQFENFSIKQVLFINIFSCVKAAKQKKLSFFAIF